MEVPPGEKLGNPKFFGPRTPRGVLWAFQNLAIFGYQYFLNGHNFGSTKDSKLVLVSNIRFWDKLSEKSLQKFFWAQKKPFFGPGGAILGTRNPLAHENFKF